MKYNHGVKRLADKKYRIRYDIPPCGGRGRQQKTETLVGVTKKQAEAIFAKRKATVESGQYVTDDDMKLSTLCEKFMVLKRQQKEANTITRYQGYIDYYLQPAFGDMKVNQIKQGHLLDAYAHWSAHGRAGRRVSGRTIRHAHETLRNILNWGVRTDKITRNVAAHISHEDLPKAPKPKPLALSEGELRTLLAEAKNPTKRAEKRGTISSQPWFYAAVAFAAYTGARRGEVLALRWSEVHSDAKSITLSQSLTQALQFKCTKSGKPRTISVSETLLSILKSHKATQAKDRLALGPAYKDDDLVFARADGSPVTPWNFGSAFQDLIKRSGVTRISLHCLRDTHASLLAKAGVPIEVISQRLGHASIGITVERYLHVYKERDADAASAFERLVG